MNLFPYLGSKCTVLCSKQDYILLSFVLQLNGTHADGNLMHTSCWEDKQTQGAILLLGGGDPVGCAANGSYVAGLHLGVPFCFSGILCQYCLSPRPIPLGRGQ